MAYAKLGKDRINSADLYPAAPTAVSKLRCFDVILSVRRQKRKSREPLEYLYPRAWSGKALQQLL